MASIVQYYLSSIAKVEKWNTSHIAINIPLIIDESEGAAGLAIRPC